MHALSLCLTFVACLITWVEAHTAFTTLFVNGASQGDGTCIRMNTVSGRVNFPIADITSDDITCGQAGITPVARTCPIKAGDTVSFQFRSGPGSDSIESIVEGHKGPCGVYMKQMSSGEPQANGTFPNQSPAGDGWFKIMYDATDSQDQWCTQRVNHTADGVITTKVPADVAPGYYLLRPELLALHAATNRDPQFYTGCAQVYISGGSGQANPEKVAIPGYVKYSDQAMSWNLYNQTGANYPEYGPKLYQSETNSIAIGQSSSSAVPGASSPAAIIQSSTADPATTKTSDPQSASQTASTAPICKGSRSRGRKRYVIVDPKRNNSKMHIHRRDSTPQDEFSCPSNTILELGNVCLPEAPHWKDSDNSMRNCWASQKYCWEIADTCWKTRSPAVSYQKGQGCDIYAARCTAVGDACKNMVMEGPPDEGKILTPQKMTLSEFGVVQQSLDIVGFY